MTEKQIERLEKCMYHSRVITAVKRAYPEVRANRILALMGNGVWLSSAILATEPVA